MTPTALEAAIAGFDAEAFTRRHGGHKESASPRSREFLLPCPFCGGDRLRWHSSTRKQTWICWHCKKTGRTTDLVMALEQVSREAAIDIIMGGYDGGDAPTHLTKVARVKTTSTQLEVLRTIAWPEGAERIDASRHPRVFAYLAGRGIGAAEIAHYDLRTTRRGRHRGYVLFPVYMDGGLIYWQGRASWDPPPGSKEERKAWVKRTGYRKTLNPTGVGAGPIVYRIDEVRGLEHVVVCEGPVDAIKVGPHAVALFGKATSPTKIERLLRLPVRRYTVYLDTGADEVAQARKLAAELSEYAPTFIAQAPPGYDPGALTPAQNAAVVAAAVPFKPTGGLVSNLRVR